MTNIGDIDVTTQRRPCEVHSNQFYRKGWWHVFYQKDGAVFALVETEDGSVERYEVSGCYSIKFMDTKP